MSVTEFRKLTIIVWLVVVASMAAVWGADAWRGKSWDTDDFMRLTQVRDLLAGQGWQDLTQYRLNPPGGTPMHWSRLADLPPAAVALALSPFLPVDDGLTIAAMIVPPLYFLLLLIVYRFPARLMLGAGRSPVGLLVAICGAGTAAQFAPGRIDHHGLQLVLITAAIGLLLAGLARDRWRGAIAFAGIPFGLSIWIGVELLPLIAAWFAVLGLAWCKEGGSLARQGALAAGLAALIGLAVLLTSVAPASWSAAACDAFSAMPVGALALVAVGFALMHLMGSRAGGAGARLVLAGIGGAIAAAGFALAFPQCLGGGYGEVDPVVRRFWLANVAEAVPLSVQFRFDAFSAIGKLWPSALALGYALWRCARSPGRGRVLWGAMALLTAAAAALIFWQVRAATIAHAVALVPLAGLIAELWARIRGRGGRLRQLAMLLPILFVGSAIFWPAVKFAYRSAAALVPASPGGLVKVTASCESRRTLPVLAAEPPSVILSYIDVGPMLLFATPHAVLGAPYHRNNGGLKSTIELFRAADDAWIRGRLQQLGVGWVVTCPGPEDRSVYRTPAGDGLAERLAAGQVPDYLAEVPAADPTAPKLYRVLP